MLEQLERVVIAFAIIVLTAGIIIGGAVGGIIGWLMSIPLIVIIPVGMATGAMVLIAMIAIWYRGGLDNLMVGTILNAVLLIGIIAAIIIAATDPSMSTAAAIAAAIFGLISLLAHFYFRA